jgi:hypothetical protein
MRPSLAVLGAAATLGIGLTGAVALGSGSSTTDPTKTAATTHATSEGSAEKVWLCHHTGSWKHPYHLIHVSANAVPAHRGHGDVDTSGGKTCPASQPVGTSNVHGNAAAQHGQAKEKESENEHVEGSAKPDDDDSENNASTAPDAD